MSSEISLSVIVISVIINVIFLSGMVCLIEGRGSETIGKLFGFLYRKVTGKDKAQKTEKRRKEILELVDKARQEMKK